MSPPVLGIDLGTTYSAIATLDADGRAITLPNRDGEVITPSAVLIDSDERAVVGQAALDVMTDRPEDVATLVKRQMGRDDLGRLVAGRPFRPETLSELILRKLIADAESRIGPVERAVVTVPAYFDDSRRSATRDAGRLAGVEVDDLLDEPVAAALAYTFGQSPAGPREPITVLVYDLGGGTFDVTVVRLHGRRFQTLAIEGDVRLGGRDWDEALARHAAEAFAQAHGSDPRDDPRSAAALFAVAERAKRTLTKLDNATVSVTHAGWRLPVPMSRERFEDITRPLLLRTKLTTQRVIDQAKLTWPQVDRVLMVGGSTHMPATAAMLRALTGRDPDRTLAVSEVVARGAAIHAGVLAARRGGASRSGLADVVEVNVSAHSLGVEVRGDHGPRSDILIPKNTQLPASAARTYRTVQDGQKAVRVRVLQGEARQAEACIRVGECWIEELPWNLPKGSPVRVRCTLGADGLVTVAAEDVTSGASARATLRRAGGLEAEAFAQEREWVAGVEVA